MIDAGFAFMEHQLIKVSFTIRFTVTIGNGMFFIIRTIAIGETELIPRRFEHFVNWTKIDHRTNFCYLFFRLNETMMLKSTITQKTV